MTPEAQQAAIVDAMGWRPSLGFAIANDCEESAPDYLHDLNAIHGAVKMLPFSKRQKYRKELQAIMSRNLEGLTIHISECIDATAAQRSEALLRALELWDDSK